ncbi:hypothetical protein ANCCEY_00264 [Ancylostoma ceylanicum]|uniref:Unspecific monooxygenase n=1 Tax=Ancylostoma ceylanicum TaxID=53326 RepID=A0A0D6MBV8_9BILA|nr:hypothetical protein ANCCEY_00264 [Ancylostoma ceylanicum]
MITLILLLTFIAVAFAQLLMKRANLPPGPFPIPLLGNVPYIAYFAVRNGGIVEVLRSLKKKYGRVFTIWFGPVPTVHITDLEVAQDAMMNHGANYSDRWVPYLLHLTRNGMGIVASNGNHWLHHRRFSLHVLRNFGLGRNIIEERIMEEFNLNDDFFAMKRKVDNIANKVSFLDLFAHKFMLSIPLLRRRYDRILGPFYQLKAYIRGQLERRKADIAAGKHLLDEEGRDYVDAYLIKMAQEMKENPKDTYFTSVTLPGLAGKSVLQAMTKVCPCRDMIARLAEIGMKNSAIPPKLGVSLGTVQKVLKQ